MGLQPSSGHFQRFMEEALQRHNLLYTGDHSKRRNPDTGLLEGFVAVYQDDLVWWDDDREVHREQITRVLDALSAEKLKLNPQKLTLFTNYTRYLGCIVGSGSLSMDPVKVTAIDNLAEPTDHSMVKQLVGMASFYRRWISDFANMVAPLTDMAQRVDDPSGAIDAKTGKIRKVEKDFATYWGDDQRQAVRAVKAAMTSYPVLRQPDPTRPFVGLIDGSLRGTGGVLCQEYDGKLCAVGYCSHKLTSAETNYPITEIEGLAVLHFVRTFRHFLVNNPFTVRIMTDHKPLQWVDRVSTRSGRVTRWMLELMDYPLRIEYIPGAVNEVADALSRLLDTTPADVASSIEVQDAVADALRHANETTVSSAQFQTDWEQASAELDRWGGEDAHTIDLLPTAWRQYPDPTALGSHAAQFYHTAPAVKQLVDAHAYAECPDFQELHSHLRDDGGDGNKSHAERGKVRRKIRAGIILLDHRLYTHEGQLCIPTSARQALLHEFHVCVAPATAAQLDFWRPRPPPPALAASRRRGHACRWSGAGWGCRRQANWYLQQLGLHLQLLEWSRY